MRIVCWQTILMKHHTLFFSKIGKDVAKFAVCCSRDWRFKGKLIMHNISFNMPARISNGAGHLVCGLKDTVTFSLLVVTLVVC